MAKQIKQFRYYNDGFYNETNNQPKKLPQGDLVTLEHFQNGSVFQGYYPIVQLGIQSLPGTKFYLNDSIDPIMIGQTGVFELDLSNNTEITSLKFDIASLKLIKANSGAYLIIDIIYDDGKEF